LKKRNHLLKSKQTN